MSNLVSKVALGLSLTCAFAMAEGTFVGFDGDYSFGSKLKGDGDFIRKAQFGLGIKGGYDFDMFRIYGAYVYDFNAKKSSIDEDDKPITIKWNTHKFLVGTDYTPSITQDFKFILGAYTGYSKLKAKTNAELNGVRETEKTSANGLLIGAKIGGEYSLDANNAIEFGFKADKTKYRKIDIKETNAGLYLGYNYKF